MLWSPQEEGTIGETNLGPLRSRE